MNTKFHARKPKKTIHPPGPGVRCPSGSDLCAAFLMAPILLGAFVSRRAREVFTLVHTRSHWFTIKNLFKIFPSAVCLPQKIPPRPAVAVFRHSFSFSVTFRGGRCLSIEQMPPELVQMHCQRRAIQLFDVENHGTRNGGIHYMAASL